MSDDEQGYVAAAKAFIADYGVEFVAVEVICVINDLALAGTIDWMGQLGANMVIGDWKTRGKRHGCYPEESAQLGAYSLADYLVVGEFPGEIKTMPVIDDLVVVSLTEDGSYAAYPIDLEQARESARAMFGSFQARQDMEELGTLAIGTPLKGAAPPPPIDAMLGLRRAWLRARVASLPPEAKGFLARTWPRTVPKNSDVMDHDQINLVAGAIDLAEKEHDVPFFSPDPRAPKAAPGSASKSRRNKATGNSKAKAS